MPTVEIDEAELMRLRTVGDLAQRMYNDPKGRRLLEEANRAIDPSSPTPTLDADKAAKEPYQKMQEELDGLKKQLADEKTENENNKKLAKIETLQQEGFMKLRRDGWQDEGIEGVKKLMEEKGILDPIDAAVLFEREHPTPEPAAPRGQGAWGFMDDVKDTEKDLKALIDSKGENNPLVDRMAREALAEFRGQQPRR